VGDWSSTIYIASQILSAVGAALIVYSFFAKKRIVILLVTLVSNIVFIVAYGFLTAYVGVGMICVEIVRDIVSYISDQRRGEKDKDRTSHTDVIMIVLWTSLLVTITAFTQDGFLSWFGFFATLTFTIGIWQKSRLVFLICAVVSEGFWIVYNIVIESVVGLAFEIILFVAAVVGLVVFLLGHSKKSIVRGGQKANQEPTIT
jgi:hypothetical protein